MYPEPSSQPLRCRLMISRYRILPALIMPASRALATIGDAQRRYARAAIRLSEHSTCDRTPELQFRHHGRRQGGQALRLSSCFGVGSLLSPSNRKLPPSSYVHVEHLSGNRSASDVQCCHEICYTRSCWVSIMSN
jgi:hypothetical protein